MRNNTVVVLILSVILSINILSISISSAPLECLSLESGRNTLYVGGSGLGNYSRIQDAIDNARSGYIIFVYNGTYYENVIVDKSLYLIGEDEETTIIDGNESTSCVKIYANGVTVSKFTIKNSGKDWSEAGINIQSSNNIISNNNIVSNNNDGICLFNSNNNEIRDNTISNNNEIGINLRSWCYDNIISKNTICFNDHAGIWFLESNYNTVLQNDVSSNNFSSIVVSDSSFNTLSDNLISYNNRSGIILAGMICGNNEVSGNHIRSNKDDGIYVYSSCNNLIKENDFISNNRNGLKLVSSVYYSSDYNLIYHNNFISNTFDAYDECSNTWDDGYPSGGNYWDNYSGIDENQDGIGDVPYYISGGNNSDYYPLMQPYGVDIDPPVVEIVKPENALYIRNKEMLPLRKPLIIGYIYIEVEVSDEESGINRVEFYIDGELKYNGTTEPYIYAWDKRTPFRFRHTIKIIAYDEAGNYASSEISVLKFF